MNDDIDQTIDAEAQWAEVEAALRESFEINLAKQKKAVFDSRSPKPPTTGKTKNAPIVHVTAVYFDSDIMMPLAIHTYDVVGTREEIARLFQSKIETLIGSVAYRKSQQAVFNRLKDETTLTDKEILAGLIPDADEDETHRVYMRLKQGRRRKNNAKRATKSPVCSPDKPLK